MTPGAVPVDPEARLHPYAALAERDATISALGSQLETLKQERDELHAKYMALLEGWESRQIEIETVRVCSVCGGPWGLERPSCDYSRGGRCEGGYIVTEQEFRALLGDTQ